MITQHAPCSVIKGVIVWARKQNKYNFPTKIVSLKTSFEEEWNKISEKLILKSCKSFRSCVDTATEKWRPFWVNLLFCVYLLILLFIFFGLKLIFFDYSVFLILEYSYFCFRTLCIYIYIYIDINNIQLASEDNGCGLFVYRL